MQKEKTLLIKNMVCPRCILAVENILEKLQLPFLEVSLGEVKLKKELTESELRSIEQELTKIGFELIETRIKKIIEDIKLATLQYLNLDSEIQKPNLSVYITDIFFYDYNYLSGIFSSIEGITIEQYFIYQRIEKVKELLVYDQLSLTQIAFKTGFSSIHHLSAQFKKVTGLTPSHFKKIGSQKRKSIDHIDPDIVLKQGEE